MTAVETVSVSKSHGGIQGVYRHASTATGTDMKFAVFVPDHPPGTRLPIVWYLSGLTCSHANVMEKGEYRAACAEYGVILVAPDTSPRGDGVPDVPETDFGVAAGFYLDATQSPWDQHFRMRSYVEDELPAVLLETFPDADFERQGIMGHSMGGHGALTIALRNPERFRSVSAFAPIVAPTQVPWGRKAFAGYLGDGEADWQEYDACRLLTSGARVPEILVDQGDADQFLATQLRPELLEAACKDAGVRLTLRMQSGYNHFYDFVSTFMADHVAWHAARLV